MNKFELTQQLTLIYFNYYLIKVDIDTLRSDSKLSKL